MKDASTSSSAACTTTPNAAEEHAHSVSGMFGRIAGWYDFLNHFLSIGLDYWWRYVLVKQLRRNTTRVLDLAAGTFDVSLEIRRQLPNARVAALDYCLPMLLAGKKKLQSPRGSAVFPVQADGRMLPLPDNSVDAVTIAFGIRNIVPREDALKEIRRVLVPGGRLCILEFGSGKECIWFGLYNFYLNRILPVVGRVLSGDANAYRYLADTINKFPTAPQFAGEIYSAGFNRVMHRALSFGIVQVHIAEKL